MHGIIRAIARLAVMGFVMTVVVVGATFVGLGSTTAIALGLVVAGVVGLVGIIRRPKQVDGAQRVEAMVAADAKAPKSNAAEAMAPRVETSLDPEANMPRWRRPSLLEARRSDPTRSAHSYRLPMRFSGDAGGAEIRVVRYAVVPVLDRPDEILGLQVSDLGSGDEVQVLGSSGGYLEVACPNGDRGWVHRTTLGKTDAAGFSGDLRQSLNQESDDAMSALLTARGLS